MNYNKYIERVSENVRRAIKVEWLNFDESVNFEFTNSLYDINVDLNVNYQNGTRRTCTLTLDNSKNKFPVNFNGLQIGQKFKLWMGIYIDNETPYYLPQGVFYVSNPDELYSHNAKTITINGVDKWAFLDGTLHGKLSGTYTTNIGVNLYDATRKLLRLPINKSTNPIKKEIRITTQNIEEYFEVKNNEYFFEGNISAFTSNNKNLNSTTARTELISKIDCEISFDYSWSCHTTDGFYFYVRGEAVNGYDGEGEESYSGTINKGDSVTFRYYKDSEGSSRKDCASFSNMIIKFSEDYCDEQCVDPVTPKLSSYFTTKEIEGKSVLDCPYTATVQRGNSYADVLLEYATILCAHIYYDVNGRLVIEPMIDDADDITDTNKEILWHYTIDEKTFFELNQKYNFDKVYNDIIVLGNIVNGYQFKARVQNKNPISDTCVQKIGLKTKEPYEDNQYYSDEQCRELAMYYAKIHTIMQKSGTIDSVSLYHLDVNKLISVSTPNNNMSKELFLVSGFSLSATGTMTINITSVNVLKDFSVVEADVYE